MSKLFDLINALNYNEMTLLLLKYPEAVYETHPENGFTPTQYISNGREYAVFQIEMLHCELEQTIDRIQRKKIRQTISAYEESIQRFDFALWVIEKALVPTSSLNGERMISVLYSDTLNLELFYTSDITKDNTSDPMELGLL